ncbi:MAG: glycosyltransferase family 2 protein [Anaerolineales bacterium]|nr:glycosyltransferase family 2 protein [Anaerolineales bacterium]
MNQPPDLSIIIVNWNVRDLLRACLESIDQNRAGLDLEVIVVDSASGDGSAAMLAADFPWVTLIACTENVGFPRGNNLGIAKANGRYILLLNPDTVVVGQALATLLTYLQDHPDVGVVGPQLLNADGSVQSSRRRFPTLATAFFESTWLESMAPGSLLDRYYVRDVPDQQTAEVDWVTGACMMAPSALVEAVGGLDEAYYMYSEELDWCRRIKAAGWRIVYLPEAQIIHYEGKSSEQAVVARHINFQQAKLRYFRKYHSRLAASLLRLFLLINYFWQLILEGFKGVLGHKRPLRRQRVQAYWAILRSGLHPAGY